ncbi:MAG: macro domain-containing protein [Nanobdellota archaeon]
MVSKFYVTFVDTNPRVINSYVNVLNGFNKFSFLNDDITKTSGDAIVSPTNSFGDMDEGTNRIILKKFGEDLQDRVWKMIDDEFGKMMPVGSARTVYTNDDTTPYIIVAPISRDSKKNVTIKNVLDTAYAIFNCVHDFNSDSMSKSIDKLLSPGLGTRYNCVSPEHSAYSINKAYLNYLDNKHR